VGDLILALGECMCTDFGSVFFRFVGLCVCAVCGNIRCGFGGVCLCS